MDPVGGNRNKQPDDTGGVKAGGSDPADVASRPRRTLLLVAGVVVLVVGGFALSRDYGVQSIPSPPNFEEIATPTTLSTAGPSTSTTTAPLAADTTPLESFDSAYDDWMYLFQDLAVSPYGGSIVGVAGGGVAWHWLDVGDWDVLDVDALPIGTGLDDGSPGRIITQVATGPSQVTAGPSTDGDVWSGVWFSGYSTSHADDDEFGGVLDGWTGSRVLDWVASYHCPVCGHWTVWTTNDVPELSGGIGDLAVSGDGTVYASVGEDLLMVLNGYQGTGWDEWKSHGEWKSYEVPLPTDSSGVSYPWSSSLAVGIDGVVWAGYNYDTGGVVRFDGADFTRYTTEDGLPSGKELRVSAAGDGTIWAATERSGVASFDGTTWTSYTTADGLLSNQAVIAAGNDGTVWAVHLDDPPFGYSRFDGSEWTTYSFDFEVGGYRAEVGPDGTLWTISDEGLISFDGITRTIHPSPFVPTLPGTITVSIDGWGGVEGYRLLAGVWSESDIVGGAFWTIIDSDPYTGTDIIHPPFWGDHPPDVEHESWGEGDYLWDETAWLEPGAYQITFWANPDELDPYGRLIPAGLIERECQVTVEVTAGHTTEVTISDIPMAGEGGECQRATDDTSVRFITFTPVQWGIILDDDRPGVHTVLMEVDARPLTAREIEDVSGRLIWDEVTVDLCNIGIDRPDGSLQIGDIFQTTEGCGPNPTAMRDAFEEFGLPEKGCLTATVGGVDHEYCAPLRATEDAFVGPEPGTVTLVLDGLEGFEGLAVDALVVPSLEDERDELAVLGEMYFGVIDIDSYSGSDVMHPQSYRDFGVAFDEVAIFPPGTYRFIIEAYVPSGDMYYGCEQQIQVVDGIPTIVSFTSLPTYTGDGWHWTPYDQLEYPDCP